MKKTLLKLDGRSVDGTYRVINSKSLMLVAQFESEADAIEYIKIYEEWVNNPEGKE